MTDRGTGTSRWMVRFAGGCLTAAWLPARRVRQRTRPTGHGECAICKAGGPFENGVLCGRYTATGEAGRHHGPIGTGGTGEDQ